MDMSEHTHWNEFEWERELRRDDARVRAYMKELPRFIDLPYEDDLLLKRMQTNPELIPQASVWADYPYSSFFEDFDFDDDAFETNEWRDRQGADVFVQIQRMSRQWALLTAREMKGKQIIAAIRVITIYGKILARLADVIDLEPRDYKGLRVALCKRIVGEINLLAGELNAIKVANRRVKLKLESHASHIHSVRESMVDLLHSIRSTT